MQIEFETTEDYIHPLDNIETILTANNWAFERDGDEQLILTLGGQYCGYRLVFMWHETSNALHFCCEYDLEIPKDNFSRAAQALMALNANLWMGHFDIPVSTGRPCFRQTCLMRGIETAKGDHLNDLVELSLAQCEQFYPLFQMIARGGDTHSLNADELSLALMETQGQS